MADKLPAKIYGELADLPPKLQQPDDNASGPEDLQA